MHSLLLNSNVVNLGTTLSNMPFTIWNGSSWTLRFEFGCYITIALILYILNKYLKKFNSTRIISIIYLILLTISFFYPRQDNQPTNGLNLISTAIYFFTIFLGGSIVYLIKDKLKFSFKILFLALIYCIIIMTLMPKYFAMEICAIPMIYIILFVSMKVKSPKWIQRNDISYGIYIYAWPIQSVIACFFITNSIQINVFLYIIICMIITSIFAIFSWFLIEKPILDRVRR